MKNIFLLSTLLFLASCGSDHSQNITNPQLVSGKIINGNIVKDNNQVRPHIVALIDLASNSICTGTIIKENVILTAAHCVPKREKDLLVVFDTKPLNLSAISYILKTKTRSVSKIEVHEGYNNGYGLDSNDIALVKIKDKLPKGFSPVSFSTNKNLIKENNYVRSVGYGLNSFKLPQIDVSKFSNEELIASIQSRKIICDFQNYKCYAPEGQGAGTLREGVLQILKVENNDFITDDKKNGICNGDSGGPSFVKVNNKLVVAGVISQTASTLGLCNELGIHLNVGSYASWIDKALKKLEK